MTRTVPIVLALSLLINQVHLLFDGTCGLTSVCLKLMDAGQCIVGHVPIVRVLRGNLLKDQYFESNLVYLLTTSLVLREHVNVIPKHLWSLCPILCGILEILLSFLLLECSLVYIWKFVQSYLLLHSDDILVHLSEEHGLDWVVCHLCCGQSNCSEVFAALVLKVASFGMLLAVCCFIGVK